ncbi:MAG TPA: hypothetical protein VII73_03880 [Caulobacteraceae bacterium]
MVGILSELAAQSDPWTISGTSCASVSHAAFAEPLKPDQVFAFDRVDFGRRFGGSYCSTASTKGTFGLLTHPVCQFSSPAVLAVRTSKGMFYFEPKVGQVATVSVSGGVARCVLASPYWSQYTRLVTHSGGNGAPFW